MGNGAQLQRHHKNQSRAPGDEVIERTGSGRPRPLCRNKGIKQLLPAEQRQSARGRLRRQISFKNPASNSRNLPAPRVTLPPGHRQRQDIAPRMFGIKPLKKGLPSSLNPCSDPGSPALLPPLEIREKFVPNGSKERAAPRGKSAGTGVLTRGCHSDLKHLVLLKTCHIFYLYFPVFHN